MSDEWIEDRVHARMSPSSIERGIECTKSVALSAAIQPSLPGSDAARGTAGHALFERCLKEDLEVIELGPLSEVEVDGHIVTIDDAMLDDVQTAVDWTREHVPRPWLLERQVKFGFAEQFLGEPVWGFLDVGCRDPLYVADLKMGFNPVGSDSRQNVMYLLGLAIEVNPGLKGDGVAGTTVVIQPQAGAPDPHEVTWQDLRDFRDWLIDGMRRIKRREFAYAHGDWCRFCPAAGVCPRLAAVARDYALTMATPTPEMVASGEFSADLLNEALNVVPRVEQWLKAINEVAKDYMIHGGALPDHVLVEKRTNRRWIETDDAKVAETLAELGADPWVQKLVSPAQAEKRLPPAKRAAVGEMSEKPAGELTVSPRATTKKPAINVGASLAAALQSRTAAGFLAAAENRGKGK